MIRQRLDIWIAFLIVSCPALERVAHADRGEASLHAQVQYGQATVGEIETPDATDTAPFLGVSARATYAISNWYAFEASLGYAWLTSRTQHSIELRNSRERHWNMAWAQANLGVTARLGVRFIPTLHAALGVQHRTWHDGQSIESDSPRCPPKEEEGPAMPCFTVLRDETTMEIVGTLGAGLDYRLGDRWIVGLMMTTQRAVVAEAPFQTVVATFHISYYFYPEGAAP